MRAFAFLICISGFAHSAPTSDHPLPYPLEETRYCGPPVRNPDGTIRRRADVIRAFKKIHPCPSTQLTTGACPGWQLDHNLPLICGGCDSVSNMGWLPVEIKTCAGQFCKDRWERRVYCKQELAMGAPAQACLNYIIVYQSL